jgi:hypothetical protein
MTTLDTAFLVKVKVSSSLCAWFPAGGRIGRDAAEMIGVNPHHATGWSASRPSRVSWGQGGSRMRTHVLLIRMWAALTTREIYESWKHISGMTPFFKEPDWNEKENHEKFRDYAVASFLELLQPGSIYWKGQNPSMDDMQSVSRIVGVLGRASEKAKLQSIRAFFEGKISLVKMRKILIGKSLSDKKEALLLVKANHELKPKEFYVRLRGPLKDLGILLSSNPNSYPKQIERLRKQAQAYLATISQNARP